MTLETDAEDTPNKRGRHIIGHHSLNKRARVPGLHRLPGHHDGSFLVDIAPHPPLEKIVDELPFLDDLNASFPCNDCVLSLNNFSLVLEAGSFVRIGNVITVGHANGPTQRGCPRLFVDVFRKMTRKWATVIEIFCVFPGIHHICLGAVQKSRLCNCQNQATQLDHMSRPYIDQQTPDATFRKQMRNKIFYFCAKSCVETLHGLLAQENRVYPCSRNI
mmetsp:Transcript_100687/g.307754  ORF Transcript_100687/g.307754 Transcript_100687/m.307754 type:complete len:218 (+) Transcript_100687:285-938(+)